MLQFRLLFSNRSILNLRLNRPILSLSLYRFASNAPDSRKSTKFSSSPISSSVDVQKTIQSMIDRYLIGGSFPETLIKDLSPLKSLSPVVYAGFDPTSDSLHVGHLLVIQALLHFYVNGFDCCALIGTATAKLGDPSGRAHERQTISTEIIERNSRSILEQLENLFKNFNEYFIETEEHRRQLKPVCFANNANWYKNLNVIDFISEIGPKFRLRHMLAKKSVHLRSESQDGMHFGEFSYQIFQAYDFLQLSKQIDCQLQIGGSDQLGNMHSGRDLIGELLEKEAYGLTVPLLLDDKGQKLGKTHDGSTGGGEEKSTGTIWLDPRKTSSFEFYQYFLRLPDSDVSKYLHLLTFLPLEEVETISTKHDRDPEKRLGQTKLAEQLTLLAHGPSGLSTARKCTDMLYHGTLDKLSKLTDEEFRTTFRGVKMIETPYRIDMTIRELAMKLGFFNEMGAAMKTIKEGGFYINYQKIKEPQCCLVQGVHILENGLTVIRIGKKNYFLVKWT